MKVVYWLLDRFVPTLLMGSSAALLAVGVLSYAPSAFGQWQTPEPTMGGDPLFATTGPDGGVAWPSGGPASSGDLPTADPIAGATQPPRTPGPGGSATPSPSGTTPTVGPDATPRPTKAPTPPPAALGRTEQPPVASRSPHRSTA